MGSRTLVLVGRLRASAHQPAFGSETRVLASAGLAQAARDPTLAGADVFVVEMESARLAPAQALRAACPHANIVALAIGGTLPSEGELRVAGYDKAVSARTPEELAAALRGVGRRAPAGASPTAAPGPQQVVMIVEDDAALRDLGEQLLEDEGYRVLVAEDGPTALAILEKETPDLILLDVVMPGMDGREVCRRIRDRPDLRAVPVIFVSALDVLGDQLQAFEAGGNDYVCKPYDEQVLLRKVANLIAVSASRRSMERVGKR